VCRVFSWGVGEGLAVMEMVLVMTGVGVLVGWVGGCFMR